MRRSTFTTIALASLLSLWSSPAVAHGTGPLPGQSATQPALRNFLLLVVAATALLLLKFWQAPKVFRSNGIALFLVTPRSRRRTRMVGRALGALFFLFILWLAAGGAKHDPFGQAVRATVLLWLALPLVSTLIGNPWGAVTPALVGSDEPEHDSGNDTRNGLICGAGLVGFLWVWFAYVDGRTPDAVASLLVIYALVFLGLRVWSGNRSVTRNEPFGAAFEALGNASVLHFDDDNRVRARIPFSGLAAVNASWLFPIWVALFAGIFLDALGDQQFWMEWTANRAPTDVTLMRTGALAVIVAAIAGLGVAAAGVMSYASRRPVRETLALLTPALLVLAPFFWLAHDLFPLMETVQELLFVVGDPLGKGWSPFGDKQGVTAQLTGEWLGVIQTIALLAGPAVGMVVAFDRIRREGVDAVAGLAFPAFAAIAGFGLLAIAWMVPA